jgi:hypothetical protein
MLQQSGKSQQDGQAQSQGQTQRNRTETPLSSDSAIALAPTNLDRRAALKAIAAGVAALTAEGAKAQVESPVSKAPGADTASTLGGVSLELKKGLTAEILKRNFGATFLEIDGKPYLQHSGTTKPNPIEIGATTLSVQCSVSDRTLQIRLIDKPDASGQQNAQFATIDKYGEISVGEIKPMYVAKNDLYPARSLQITHQEHPELHAALGDMAKKGYSFNHTLSAKSADYYALTDQSGKVIAKFEHNIFRPGGVEASMKEWAQAMKDLE